MKGKLKSKLIADSYNSWLIIDNDKDVCRHSLSMMEGVAGFLSLNYKEDEERFYVNISKYLSLRESLNYSMNEEALLNLALQAVEMRIEAIKFLLPTEGIVYDIDYSYFEPVSKTLHMVFLPNRETSTEGDFLDWLKELIELSLTKANSEGIESLLRYLDSEEYSLINLRQRILLASEDRKGKEALYVPKRHSIKDYSKPKIEGDEKTRSKIPPRLPKGPIERGDVREIRKLREAQETRDGKILKKAGEKSKEEGEKAELVDSRMRRLALILSQIAMMLLYLACLYFFKNRVNPFYKLALGLLIFFGLIDYVVIKNLISKTSSPKTGPEDRRIVGVKKSPEPLTETADSNSTLYLGDLVNKRARLVNLQNGTISPIDKRDFKIGREGYEADLSLSDKSVGRLHAFIREEGGHYYLIDNASINGTYINGIRIRPGEYNEIMAGDELIFSRLSFEFSKISH